MENSIDKRYCAEVCQGKFDNLSVTQEKLEEMIKKHEEHMYAKMDSMAEEDKKRPSWVYYGVLVTMLVLSFGYIQHISSKHDEKFTQIENKFVEVYNVRAGYVTREEMTVNLSRLESKIDAATTEIGKVLMKLYEHDKPSKR